MSNSTIKGPIIGVESTTAGLEYDLREKEDIITIDFEDFHTPDKTMSSSEYFFKLLNELSDEILNKYDELLMISKSEKSESARLLRSNLESFFISLKQKYHISSQLTSNTDVEYIYFEPEIPVRIGMSESVAKRLWDNEDDEWWNDL